MAVEQFRVLTLAKTLPDFTATELAKLSGVNANTVKSLIRRNQRFFEKTGEMRRSPGAKKPAEVMRVRAAEFSALERVTESEFRATPPSRPDRDRASRALLDGFSRWEVRRCLNEARRAGAGEARARWIEKAEEWMGHEEERLDHWGKVVEPPAGIAAEVAELRDRVHAFAIGVDRLADLETLRTPEGAIHWMAAGFIDWAAGRRAEAFAPLSLDPDRPLPQQIAAAIATGGVGTIAPERLMIGGLGALREVDREAFPICTETLLAIGGDRLAAALRSEFEGRDPDTDPAVRRGVLSVLGGLALGRELVNHRDFTAVQAWLGCFATSPMMRPLFAPRLLLALTNIRQSKLARVTESLAAQMDAFREADLSGDNTVHEMMRRVSGFARDVRRAYGLQWAPPLRDIYQGRALGLAEAA